MWSCKPMVVPLVHKSPVPVKSHLQESLLQATCHPFYAGFRLIARMQRLIGCCFLENIGCDHSEDVRARRFSLYLLYPLCIWIHLLTVGIVLLVDAEQHKHRVQDTVRLNEVITFACVLTLNFEVALNNVLLLFRAPDLVELLRMCSLIELHVNVPTYRLREAVRSAWNIIAFQLADTALNMALDVYADFGALVLVERGRQLKPFPMAVLVSYGCVGIVFLAGHGLSVRVLLTYCSRSIVLYVNCIRTNLDRSLRSRGVPESSKVLLVDHVRAQLSLVKNLADMVSSMLGPSLLYAYAYSVFLLCVSAYYTTVVELPFRVRLFYFFFFTLHWFSILVPPVEVHRMRNAVTELRSVVQCVPTADYSDDLLVQLRMLLYAIKHDDLKFTGCGFFTVDLSTFAGITGAVITYTVVLAQTSESYFRDTLVHSSNITVA
ncbi:gustatory receptor 66a [Dermacentor variabilis]|uniref:gustatory receptor 66a n=1 Tax=Dermacentor variabilis TaxID=34621 RepID=UPI003F5BDD04